MPVNGVKSWAEPSTSGVTVCSRCGSSTTRSASLPTAIAPLRGRARRLARDSRSRSSAIRESGSSVAGVPRRTGTDRARRSRRTPAAPSQRSSPLSVSAQHAWSLTIVSIQPSDTARQRGLAVGLGPDRRVDLADDAAGPSRGSAPDGVRSSRDGCRGEDYRAGPGRRSRPPRRSTDGSRFTGTARGVGQHQGLGDRGCSVSGGRDR